MITNDVNMQEIDIKYETHTATDSNFIFFLYPTQVQYGLLLLSCTHQNDICIQAKQLIELSTVTRCRCA